jgi:hypothetical protein
MDRIHAKMLRLELEQIARQTDIEGLRRWVEQRVKRGVTGKVQME